MQELGNMLKNKKSLTTLGIEYNRIRARGIQFITGPLSGLPKLERLFFNQN